MTPQKLKIVIDLDDTISFCTNRDFANAKPNVSVIQKINELYHKNWEIEIRTARGQLSCNGDYAKAEEKYGAQVRKWLGDHGVFYHLLSFEKPLATFYVDDRALRPEEFAKMDVQPLFGMSGSSVLRVDNRVVKTDERASEVADWYERARFYGFNVPTVHSVIGKQITMDFEYGVSVNSKYMSKVCSVVDKFKRIPANSSRWESYVVRLIDHANLIESEEFKQRVLRGVTSCESIEKYMKENSSFCHGDFSVDNIICNEERILLIDPIPATGNDYSSWLLDITKLSVSVDRFCINDETGSVYNMLSYVPNDVVRYLKMSHWLRMRKYHSDKAFVDGKINGYLK